MEAELHDCQLQLAGTEARELRVNLVVWDYDCSIKRKYKVSKVCDSQKKKLELVFHLPF